MRKLYVAIFFTILELTAYSQYVALPRHALQQQYIIKHFITDQEKVSIETTTQADSLLHLIESSWSDYVRDSLAKEKTEKEIIAFRNLDAYSYMISIIWKTGKSGMNREVGQHLYEEYMLPALIKDYQAIKQSSSATNLELLWSGSLSNTIIFGTRYASAKSIDSFYNLFFNLKELINSAYSGQKADKFLNEFNDYEYELLSKYHYLKSRPEEAFSNFITGLSVQKIMKERVFPLGKTLVELYRKNQPEKAFTLLNAIMIYTSHDEIHRDSLLDLYNYVDTKKGPRYFDFIAEKLSGTRFKTQSSAGIKLLPPLNIIANHISANRLHNAKYVLLDFWYSACAPCISEFSQLNELASKLKDRHDILFISINTDYTNGKNSEAFLKNFIKKNNLSFPVVYDNHETKFDQQFKLTGYPTKYIIDNKGNLITKIDGSPVTINTFYELINSTFKNR